MILDKILSLIMHQACSNTNAKRWHLALASAIKNNVKQTNMQTTINKQAKNKTTTLTVTHLGEPPQAPGTREHMGKAEKNFLILGNSKYYWVTIASKKK